MGSDSSFSRLVSWEVWNFMSIKNAKCEFDERNIINLKGYNDSGKSAMLIALKVLLFNSNPSKQVGFIQDDKEYFRVLGTFSDGVRILRDKYINGQSLYEMYKDDTLVYSSKSGNSLARITEVPKPIMDYLGLVMYDNMCINARSCTEKGIGVDTTGSENYKMFNMILKSEEIATAGALLNNDKNKLVSDINATDSELGAYKATVRGREGLTLGLLTRLKDMDKSLDEYSERLVLLDRIESTRNDVSNIAVLPELPFIDNSQLVLLQEIDNIRTNLSSVVVTPEVGYIDGSRLEELETIRGILGDLSSIEIAPELGMIDCERLHLLSSIEEVIRGISSCDSVIASLGSSIESSDGELKVLRGELETLGVRMVKCPCCGMVFSADDEHCH